MKIVKMIMMAVVLAAAGISAYAQQGQGPMPGRQGGQYTGGANFGTPPGPGGPPEEQQREEVRKKMETVRMWRLIATLKLDTKTSTKLAALLSSIDQRHGALMQEKMGILQEVRISLNTPNPDEKKLKTALEKFRKKQEEMQDLRKKELNGVNDILTVEQQARYLVFQHEFQREMRGMIVGARGQACGGKGMRGGPTRPGGPMGGGADKEAAPPSP